MLRCAAIFPSLLIDALLAVHGQAGESPAAAGQVVKVEGFASVLDGDTLEIGPVLIRLQGIDAPETGKMCRTSTGGEWPCGRDIAFRLEKLVDGQPVVCEALDRDPYGRIISDCHVGGINLSEWLIDMGLAWAFVEYSERFVDREAQAQQRGIGVWQAPSQSPWAYRDDKWGRAVAASPDGCPIKGNNSQKTGEKIYHTPWSPNFARTKIDQDRQERWFCDEGAAMAAGWRSSRSR